MNSPFGKAIETYEKCGLKTGVASATPSAASSGSHIWGYLLRKDCFTAGAERHTVNPQPLPWHYGGKK